jgi:hypothetical protein
MPNIGLPELIIIFVMFGIPILIVVGIVSLVRRSRPAAGPQAPSAPPGWLADPVRRHQYRYWDGAQWTSTVSDDGAQTTDPL